MRAAFNSLTARLLLASALLLPLFLGATGSYLDRSYRISIEAAEAERLQLLILTLLAEAEFDRALRLPPQLLEVRFNQPDSGLYAQVTDSNNKLLWSSPSTLTQSREDLSFDLPDLPIGGKYFSRGHNLFQQSYQVAWQTQEEAEVPLLFTVLETVAPADAQLASYRGGLMFWLGGTTLLLLACQALILLWSLRPLRQLAQDISSIESGAVEKLDNAYPREVQAVTNSLNTLLVSEKKRRAQVRNTLSDLAHSLKTPLAVIRSADSTAPDYSQLVREQTSQMEEIVDYQLRRAAGGPHKLLQMVAVEATAKRLRTSLLKVYADKAVSIQLKIEPGCLFRGDERDLMELLGILMDNACKYGKREVIVMATGGSEQSLLVSVEDDGEGIPPNLREAILERGVRADTQQSGHGIGLAVATDLTENYLGTLELRESSLGGALVQVQLP
ncbi:MAG: two-component system sensor histidine kinase PhoQ [Halioglobus sp.]|jgi:two-component system sensor histidine kinase PhoQ